MITGTSSYVELPPKTGWRASSGAYVLRSWEGPTAGLASFMATINPNGLDSWEAEDRGDLTLLTCTYESGSQGGFGTGNDSTGLIEDSWELDGEDAEISLWRHPAVLTPLSGLTTAAIAAMKGAIEAAIQDGTDPGDFGNSELNSLRDRLIVGEEAMSVPKYVLRHVLTVRRNSSLTPYHANIGRNFTYTQIGTAPEFASLASQNLIASSGLTAWRWIKRTPTVKPTSRGLWTIEQEYSGATSVDTWIYPNAVLS